MPSLLLIRCNAETLETMLNISVRETEDDEKQRLKDLSKDEIIEHFLRVRMSFSGYHDRAAHN